MSHKKAAAHEPVHELAYFKECTFGDGGHYYHDGFDRAVCTCGWTSASSRDHKALVALFKFHADQSSLAGGPPHD